MKTITPGSKVTLTAMYDESGFVVGCASKEQAWACHFCMWEDCPMKGKNKEAV